MREEILCPPEPNRIKDYAQLVLECGTQYMYLLKLCKSPDRDRMLGLLKMLMVTMKSNNNLAKYPLDILRMLVQQYSVFPQRQAHQTFYQTFVNTRGKADTYIPCDLAMEWAVRDEKRHVKHMVSNKTDSNILNRSSALGGIEKIACHFDIEEGTRDRSKRHSHLSALADEVRIIEDLRTIRPFKSTAEKRDHSKFKNIAPSMLQHFDGYKFKRWFTKYKLLFDI